MRLVNDKEIRDIMNEAITELVADKNTIIDFVNVLTDSLLYGHLLGVANVSVQLGMSYEFPHKKLVSLAKAGLMHDIGKLFIDRDILYRPCRLTADEFEIVKQHPQLGYQHMQGKCHDDIMKDAIKHHHEKIGGTGYPDGLQKSRFITEIITVADIYSALTEARVYKKAMPVEKALSILESDDGLNQAIVDKLRVLTYDDVTDIIAARRYARMMRKRFHVQEFAKK